MTAVPSATLARQWEVLNADERKRAFLQAEPATQLAVFQQWPREIQEALLRSLEPENIALLMRQLAPDRRTAVLAGLQEAQLRRLLDFMDPEDRRVSELLLAYPPQSVGRLMSPDIVAVQPDWTVAQTFARLREQPRAGALEELYVVDEQGILIDALALKLFVLSEPGARVEELLDHEYVALRANADRRDAVGVMLETDLPALPVVNEHGELVGEVTFDDVFDVAQEEFTEDLQIGAAIAPIGNRVRSVSAQELYRKRIGWLVVLVFVNLVSGAIISRYEDVITQVVALVVFLPLLIGSSGNAGSQAATMMVRALATGDVTPGDWGRLMLREVGVSAALGLTMGLAVAVLGTFRAGMEVALVVALTMLVVVVLGSLIGLSLPFLLEKLKLDPTTASGPLVTSLADITGVVVYFAIATWLLRLT